MSIACSSADVRPRGPSAAPAAIAAVLALIALRPWNAGEAPRPATLPGGEGAREGKAHARVDAPRSDCRLCHAALARELAESLHGAVISDCLECHCGSDDHVLSFGAVPAPDLRTHIPEAQTALCSECHVPSDPAFICHARMQAGTSCLDCHRFHDGAPGAAGVPASHGLRVEDVAAGRKDGTRVRGAVEAGIRGVDGRSRQHGSDTGLQPGPRLVRGYVHAVTDDPDSALDEAILEVRGLGDPVSSARLELGRRDAWRFRAGGRRSEDRFDPSTILHDAFTTRRDGWAEFEAEISDDVDVDLGYDRFDRSGDLRLTRYREISNELFGPADGDLDETADAARFGVTWRSDSWTLRLAHQDRWWRSRTDAEFLDPNLVLPDSESWDERERAFTTRTALSGGGRLGDEAILDFEAVFAWSRRVFDWASESRGLDAAAAPYAAVEDAGGTGYGRYARLEAGVLLGVAEDLDLELRFRFRNDDEDAGEDFVLAVAAPPGSPPVVTPGGASIHALDRTFDVEGLLGWQALEDLRLAAGYAVRFEDLEVSGTRATNQDGVDHGLLFEVDAEPAESVSIRGRLRAFTAGDPWTAVEPERSALAEARVRWRPDGKLELAVFGDLRRTRLAASGSRSDVSRAGGSVTWGDEDLSIAAGLSLDDYETEVDTVARLGGFPAPYEARFDGRAWVWTGRAGWRPLAALELSAEGALADVEGDNDSLFGRAGVAAAYAARDDLTVRGAVWWFDYDGTESDQDDFESTVLEFSLEWRF